MFCDTEKDILTPDHIVLSCDSMFVGDSIAYLGPWNYSFVNSLNRGSGGATTKLWTTESYYSNVIKFYSGNVYVFLGINDLGLSTFLMHSTVSNYVFFLNIIKHYVVNEIYLMAVLPINISIYTQRLISNVYKHGLYATDEKVRALNNEISDLAYAMNFQYIDIYSTLASNGETKSEYTDDGIHPNGTGYNLIIKTIQESTYCINRN